MEAQGCQEARWSAPIFRRSDPMSADGAELLPPTPEGHRGLRSVSVPVDKPGAFCARLHHDMQALKVSEGELAQDRQRAVARGAGQHGVESFRRRGMEGASAWLYQASHLEEAASECGQSFRGRMRYRLWC